MIVKAAVLFEGKIYTVPKPGRHHNVMRKIVDETGKPPVKALQGFVTYDGIFLDRVQAGEHAIRCGQLDELGWPPFLYSEDLW